jgi:hypothetical protein
MEATATGYKPMTDIPNSRRSPMEHERYLPDAQTDAPELQRFSPYAVDGGFDAYGQMEEDEFGDYYNREDADATIQSAQAEIAKLRAALAELMVLMDAVCDGDYTPDSFTTQPARAALAQDAIE